LNQKGKLKRLGFFSHNFCFKFKIKNTSILIQENDDYSLIIDGQFFKNLLETEKIKQKRLQLLLNKKKNAKFDSKKLLTLVISPDKKENISSNRDHRKKIISTTRSGLFKRKQKRNNF
jgi:hypothetical protein